MHLASTIEDVATACIEALEPEAKRVFASLCLFPSAPNTFAEPAAIAVSGCEIATIKSIIDSGLVERTETSQLAVPSEVAQIARRILPRDRPAELKFAGFFADYVDAHQEEPRALAAELVNMIAAFDYGDDGHRVLLALGLSRFLEMRGDYTTWHRLVMQAVPSNDTVAAALELERARSLEKLGHNRLAAEHATLGLGAADPSSSDAAKLLAMLGHVEMNMGRLNEAHAHLTAAVELSQAILGTSILCQALRSLGVVATRLARYDEAQVALDRALGQATQFQDTAAEATLWTDIGVLRLLLGNVPEAIVALQRAIEAAQKIGYSEKKAAALEVLGGVLIQCGQLPRAEALIEEALAIAREIGHAWYVSLILIQKGNLLLAMQDADEALSCYNEAIRERPADSADIHAHALFGKARAYASKADHRQARTNGEEALSIFDQMSHHAAANVRDWLAQHVN